MTINPADIEVGLDAGHGENTYDETGSKGVPGLEEHHFNAAAVRYAKEYLEFNGFRTFLTQPLNGRDVSLRNRSNSANAREVDILMSFHADANVNHAARGHWGFFWYNSPNGKRLAQIWAEELNKETGTRHRGDLACSPNVSWPNFHMVREPKMVSVLQEHAFMTNAEDLELLKSEKFRRQCGKAAAKTVCRYYNIPFKDKDGKTTVIQKEEDEMLEHAIVISSTDDYPAAKRLAAKLGVCPVFDRAQVKGKKVAKNLYIVGGPTDGYVADKIVPLTGPDYFAAAASVKGFLSK